MEKRRRLIGTESPGIYDAADIAEMALRGIEVVTVGWGQDVYQIEEIDEGEDKV